MLQKVKLGDFEAVKNGKKIKYVIENLATESEINEAVQHMKIFFLPREPLCAMIGIKNDPESTKSYLKLFTKGLSEGTGIGAYQINNDGSKGKLIGANITYVSKKDDEDEKYEGEKFNTVMQGISDHLEASKLYEKYNVDKYLGAHGLSVDSDFHGYQLGYRLLQNRQNICKLLDLSMTATDFSAGASQHLALKLGYETIVEWDYTEYKINGEYPYANMYKELKEKSSKVMACEFK